MSSLAGRKNLATVLFVDHDKEIEVPIPDPGSLACKNCGTSGWLEHCDSDWVSPDSSKKFFIYRCRYLLPGGYRCDGRAIIEVNE